MNIRKKTISGSLWNVTRTFTISFTDLFVYMYLARVLTLEEFGVLAFCLLVVEFANTLTNVGVNQNLIQRKDWDADYFSSVFTFVLCVSLFFTLILALIGSSVALYAHSKLAALVILALSILPVLVGLQSIFSAKMERDFLNKEITTIKGSTAVFSGLLTIGLAFNDMGLWAVVIGKIVQHSSVLIWFFCKAKLKVSLGLNRAHVDEITSFCIPLFAIAVINFLHSKASNLYVGMVLGAEKFALISVSKKGAEVLSQLSITSINKMIVPSMSRIEADKKVAAFYKVLHFTSLVIIPSFLGLGAVSEKFILLSFGEKFAESAIFLQITTSMIIAQTLTWFLPNLLISEGKTKDALRLKLISVVGSVIVSGFTVWFGVEVMLISMAVASYLIMPIIVSVVKKHYDIELGKMIKLCLPSIISSFVMILSIKVVEGYLEPYGIPLIFDLLVLVCVGGLTYAAMVILFFRRSIGEIFSLLKKS
ncbi:oligosaccharide flippase family protein [Alteromonas stellipolaris]|uniref:oligosaccharide flippase family protein n=1 Tax=Alteromonas stellipolaris TaxID=233316 RepID=UPI001D1B6610|nr:oligosaccharide flippase family protein [Alteromonas stellipolaris]MBZ2163145.1 oligosaccharide flippase family protein [Alteromonas stellipolaris]